MTLTQQSAPYAHWDFVHPSSGDRLRIIPERGGLVSGWVCGGREVLYFDQDRYADPSKSIRGGIPVLFPICGNLPDDVLPVHRQHIIGQVAADRKQHRNAAANAFAGIGVAVLIEIQDLPSAAHPTADQSTPLRNDPQPITAAGMHKVPVGVGGRLLGEGHGHPPERGVATSLP